MSGGSGGSDGGDRRHTRDTITEKEHGGALTVVFMSVRLIRQDGLRFIVSVCTTKDGFRMYPIRSYRWN